MVQPRYALFLFSLVSYIACIIVYLSQMYDKDTGNDEYTIIGYSFMSAIYIIVILFCLLRDGMVLPYLFQWILVIILFTIATLQTYKYHLHLWTPFFNFIYQQTRM